VSSRPYSILLLYGAWAHCTVRPPEASYPRIRDVPAIIGAGGMASTAFGAHGLKSRGYSAEQIHAWEAASSFAVREHPN
jgi:hypothetical protein